MANLQTIDSSINGDNFHVVVEERGHSPVFSLPSGWSSTEHLVGDLNVTVVAPVPSSPAFQTTYGLPIVTFHDIGLNAATCFASFFAYAHAGEACPELYAACAHYHVTAPGHLPNAPDLSGEKQPSSWEDLARMVREVIVHFQLKRVVAIGVGAGASVLVHVALDLGRVIAGLVLVSPLFLASGYVERALALVEGPYVRGLGLGRREKDRFLTRWLTQETLDSNHDLVTALDDGLNRLNANNILHFMQAEAWRNDLSLRLSSVEAKVLIFTGRESSLRFHSADCFAMFNPARTSWIDISDAGSLILDEFPDRAATGLSLFLQGFGVYEPRVRNHPKASSMGN